MGMEKSKLVDKNIYVKWYNLAKDEIKTDTLIPERTKEEIFNLISRENWLLFCQKGEDKDDAITKGEPNVFFDVLSKEGNLTGYGRLGLTFNNLPSYDKFKTIMSGINRETKDKINKKIIELSHDWKINVNRKTKKYHHTQTPEYLIEGVWNTKNIGEDIIKEILSKARQIREEGIRHREDIRQSSGNPRRFYAETPTINLMEAEFKLGEDEFRDRISEIFSVLILCLKVKGEVEVNRIMRDKVKKLNSLIIEKELLIKEMPKRQALIGIAQDFTEETISRDKNHLEDINKEIEQLESEMED
jgi:hypothetical protein